MQWRSNTPKCILKRTADKQFMFNLHAKNTEIILTSERYTAKASAEYGIGAVRESSRYAERYNRLTSRSGEPYFTLEGKNGEVIGTSEMYSSAQAPDKGIESVKTNGPKAPVDDQTE